MQQKPFDCLTCPLDGLALEKRGNSFYCERNHCFDIDRKGAVNLLPVQFKKSKNPGDSKEMVLARRRFLEGGFYGPIADAVCAALDVQAVIFDAGCGEGYYTQAVAEHLKNRQGDGVFSIAGMDISKEAIAAAASRNKDIQWLVGTNAKIPVRDGSVDCVLSLFGFPVWDEFKRILRPGGKLIAVDPGPDHLIELRRVLYPEQNTKEKEAVTPAGFSLQCEERLTFSFGPLTMQQIADLIWMTPHAFRAKAEDRQKALSTIFNEMTADVVFRTYT